MADSNSHENSFSKCLKSSISCDNVVKQQQSITNKEQKSMTSLNNNDMSRGKQRWQLLSKAVRMKQFDLQELQSFKMTNGIDHHLFNCDYNSTTSESISSENSSRNSLNEQLDHSNPLHLIETYGIIDYRLKSDELSGYDNWIECRWNEKWCNDNIYAAEFDEDIGAMNNSDNFADNDNNNNNQLQLFIKLVNNQLQLKHLAGFDNSGNVRIWGSEEAMGHILAHNRKIRSRLKGKILCELGSGCSALAGLIAAKCELATEIYLTDGNERCIDNIKQIVIKNFPHMTDIVSSKKSDTNKLKIIVRQLCWNQFEDHHDLKNRMEIIICADCLFRSDAHQSLIDIIDFLLVNDTNDGQVIIVAPKRGDKLDRFIRRVSDDGRFFLQVYFDYDKRFTQHFERLRAQEPYRYDPDSTYPYLLIMERRVDAGKKNQSQ